MSAPHTNDSSLHPPEDVSGDDSSSVSSSRSRSSAETTIRGPATNFHQRVPTYTYYNRKRLRRLMGVKRSARRKANDPYDYEQKYPEDEEFHEMGPMARIWKIFWDECTKYDSDMVEDWRDGLDVLLVFAGLFSAVVSTFVAQTCQSLQLNWNQVSAALTFELIHVQRAIAKGHDVDDVPSSQLNPDSAVQSSRTDVWVNALWFTSLALSLTTALIAVLTKQWIHQYMSVPSGTPRDRSRIRQFRYNCLKHWRVPVIIGLLPVLMHLALGIFFTGLVVYLRSLNYAMSYVVTTIAAMAFVVYFGTNIIPWYRPECPYKTPLSVYAYPLFSFVRRRVCALPQISQAPARLWAPWDSAEDRKAVAQHKAFLASSLKSAEREMVRMQEETIDAKALYWLHKVSSNSTVLKVVLQAISGLPLQSTQALIQHIPSISEEITEVAHECTTLDTQTRAQRFHRALHRIESLMQSFFNASDKYRTLLNDCDAQPAIAFLRSQILAAESDVIRMDVHMWTLLFRYALFGGSDWLEINIENSAVWSNLLNWLVETNESRPYTNHGGWRPAIVETEICLDPINRKPCSKLSIIDLPDTNVPLPLNKAIQKFLYPSFCDTIVKIGFPSLCRGRYYDDLPGDIRFHLALIQSSYVQQTSIPWHQAEGDILRNVIGYVFEVIRKFVNYDMEIGHYVMKEQYPSILPATFLALRDVVTSDGYGTSTLLTMRDERNILAILLRAANMAALEKDNLCEGTVMDPDLDSLPCHDHNWLSDCVMVKLEHVLFGPVPARESVQLPCQLWADALRYAIYSPDLFNTFGLALYTGMVQQNWLSLVDERYENCGSSIFWDSWKADFSYPAISFLASAYVDGLSLLRTASPTVFEKLENQDLKSPSNVVRLCQALLMADVEQHSRLEKLHAYVEPTIWKNCLHTFTEFLHSDNGQAKYNAHCERGRRVDSSGSGLGMKYASLEQLDALIQQLSDTAEGSGQSTINSSVSKDETLREGEANLLGLRFRLGWQRIQTKFKPQSWRFEGSSDAEEQGATAPIPEALATFPARSEVEELA